MVPEHRADHVGGHLDGPVGAANVREFVAENKAKGGGTPAQHQCHGQGGQHHNRRAQSEVEGNHRPAFLAAAISSAMRSRSSSESRDPSLPSSVVTTLAWEPSKKVSTRWLSADLRAVWRGTVGR